MPLHTATMSRAVRVHLIAPSAVRERNEYRYSRATAQDFALSRGRWLPAKRAEQRPEQAFQPPTLRTNRLAAFQVKLHRASSNREPLGFAPAPLLNGTIGLRPAGTCTLICK